MEPVGLLLLLGGALLLGKGRGSGGAKPGERYKPGGEGQRLLFEEAIRVANSEPDHKGRTYDIPLSWASDPGLIFILKNESGGYVGRPNFTLGPWLYPGLSQGAAAKKMKENPQDWPKVWAVLKNNPGKTAGQILNVFGVPGASTAVGLGQATWDVVQTFYPNKEQGVGDALEEAVGMLRYIKRAYGTPGNAADCWDPPCAARPDKHWKGY